MSAARLTAVMCIAEVLGMLGFSTFPALIPEFEAAWNLTRAEAGVISGAYFAGYVAAVPVLTGLTDRVDPKRIILFSLALGGAASVGYAALAGGVWSASAFRVLQGAGLAGTYMPGLKALSDHVAGTGQSRSVAFYTSGFGVGAALSFVVAGEVAALAGWRWAFAATAVGSGAALAITAIGLPRSSVEGHAPDARMLDFRPVLENRPAMRYIVGYMGHNWELFALRSWMVPFLVFALGAHGGSPGLVKATTVAAVATLLGVPSSVLGNEIALRFGRLGWIALVAGASVLLGCMIGFSASVSYGLAVALCLAYGVLAAGDSAALTAGTVATARSGQRGVTLAMHSFIGFMGGIVAPPAVGAVLDLTGRDTVFGWGVAFAAVAFGSAIVLAAVFRRGRG